MTELQQNSNDKTKSPYMVDVIIVGAGFSGLFMLYRLRELGFSTRVLETAAGVGGTWYWNRYPGARCDVESVQYSYSLSDELGQEWHWTERYAGQPEILRYLNYVADKFNLRKDIQLETRVETAIFDETLSCWNIQTDSGNHLSAKFIIMATGCLSKAKIPHIKGLLSISKYSVLRYFLNNSRTQLAIDLWFSPIDRARQGTQVYKDTKYQRHFEGVTFPGSFKKSAIYEIFPDYNIQRHL